MLNVNVENFADVTVVECKGRLVQSDAVFKLRNFVTAQTDPTVILDLSAVKAIGGGGVGMLVFLNSWLGAHGVQLKLFSPSKAVIDALAQNGLLFRFNVVRFKEMMNVVANAEDARLAA